MHELDLDLVVLQACHSEVIGRIFQKKVARHVICISKDRKVLDDTSIAFTHRLYERLFAGEKVCKAFYAVKR